MRKFSCFVPVMTNYYQVLGVANFAPSGDIKAAYRQMSKKWHPDLNNGSAYHTEKFKELQEAYACLSDDSRRDAYDQRLRAQLYGYSYEQQTYTGSQQYRTYTTPPSQSSYPNRGSGSTGLSGRGVFLILYLLFTVLRIATCDSSRSYEPDVSTFQIDPATRLLIDSVVRSNGDTLSGDTLFNKATPPVPDLPALSR